MAEKLTPQQQAAVSDRGGNLLVSAAAGSGKTKVLVDRLLGYLKDPIRPSNLDDFLIITYTKAAAAELRGKIAAKLTEAVADDPENRHLQQQMQRLYLTKISTVHAFCGDILREYAYMLDISGDFRVADETECLDFQLRAVDQVLENAYKQIDSDSFFRAFIDSQGFGRDDRQVPELILKVYNSARCHLRPDEWLDWCISSGEAKDMEDAAQTVWGAYLISELRGYLTKQIDALNDCVQRASVASGMEKPALLLQDTAAQLQRVLECTTWDEIRRNLFIDFGRLVFPRKCSDELLAAQMKAVRTACKKGVEKRSRRFADSSEQILSDMKSVCNAARGLVNLVRAFAAAYDKLKHSHRILDFGDLEHKMLDLLLGKSRSGPTTAAAEISSRFREVMVDEYQDSNAVQDAIFSALTQIRQNCFMVGDVKQSIYQFRLADPGIFLQKYNIYVPAHSAVAGQDRKILLSSNFRSSAAVIDAVNDVFTTCMSPEVGGLTYGEDEALYEGIPHGDLGDSEIELHAIAVQKDTYHEESAFVANRIAELLDGKHMVREGDGLRPICPEDIVILLRSPGSVGGDFCKALENRGIPCTMGGSADLLKTEEVSTLCALLQIINNPLQDIPLLAVLASRLFCFTANELAEFRKGDRKSDIYSVLQSSEMLKVKEFLGLLNDMRSEARMRKLTEILGYVFAVTHIDSIFASLPDGEERTENLQRFCQFAANWESNGMSDLTRFLEQLSVVSRRGLTIASEEGNTGTVTVMSIHKSKGLEFPVVFLCGLAREFNRESARAAVLCDKELGLGLSCANTATRIRYPSIAKAAISVKIMRESLSEEMRVLYVAMTRAKDRLIMTYASANLEEELTDIAMRMDICQKELLTSGVDCPGKWILLSALGRTEAGALFALCGKPEKSHSTDHPWHISVTEAPENIAEASSEQLSQTAIEPALLQKLEAGLHFSYAYMAATRTPSKQTATQLKGRNKDREAAEHTVNRTRFVRRWRKPSFSEVSMDGKAYGSAVHAVMQYIRYEACGSEADIRKEAERLADEGYIPKEYANIVDCASIAGFFDSDIGRKLRSVKNVLREFKFSIMDDGGNYTEGMQGEKVLLQGVVDCALIESDGITVIDFKSDYVTEDSLNETVDKYAPQVNTYAKALSRIYRLPVKLKLIYFFGLRRFASVE